ncbi:MAG TPA: alpha/beta fold hydrolase [Polyangiales bacterium]
MRRPNALLRLFCFPYAGGSTAAFRTWPAQLSEDVEVVGIELPGRNFRRSERPPRDAQTAAAGFCDAVASELSVPFALYGHSVGALLAYEVAHTLRTRGLPMPLALFVSGRKPPHDLKTGRRYGSLPDSTLLATVAELGGVPDLVLREPELRQMMTPVLRADLAIAEQYPYAERSPLDQPLFVYAAESDPLLDINQISEWSYHSAAQCKVRRYRGGHFFIQDTGSSFLKDLAVDLRSLSPFSKSQQASAR